MGSGLDRDLVHRLGFLGERVVLDSSCPVEVMGVSGMDVAGSNSRSSFANEALRPVVAPDVGPEAGPDAGGALGGGVGGTALPGALVGNLRTAD